MADEIKEIIKDILNDRDIFFYHPGAKLFEKDEMNELKIQYKTNQEKFKSIIENKIEIIEEEIKDKNKKLRNIHDNWQKKQTKHFIRNKVKCQKLARSLIDKSLDSPFLLERILNYLDDFGILSYYLTYNMLDDVRRVMEETNLQMTEQYVLYKIGKERNSKKKKSLRSLLEYIERLYALNLSLDERAFIIGKLISFSELPKVMVNE